MTHYIVFNKGNTTKNFLQGLDNAPLTFVESLEQLHEMAARLEGARELAVDLENHSFRSFQGFCCLMQLSTREEDFVVDVLKLRSHIGPVLAPYFADPQVRIQHP